jgi:hypothetical protein
MQQRGHFLQPGTRGPHQADRATPHGVGETQADPVDDGGPALRSHHEQPAFAGASLESGLVVEPDAIAENKRVQARREGLLGLGHRVPSRDRDDGEIRPRGAAHRSDNRARWQDTRWPHSAGTTREGRFRPLQRGADGSLVLASDGDHEVVGTSGVGRERPESGIAEGLLVGRRGQHQRRRVNAGQTSRLVGNAHQRDRIDVMSPDDLAG